MFDPSLSSDASRDPRRWDRQLRRQSMRQKWPVLMLIPVLVGVLHACAFSVLIQLFLGESFGLSNGHPAPWVGSVAVLFLVSFWVNRFLGRWNASLYLIQAVTFAGWLVAWIGWLAVDPAFNDSRIWSSPGELVSSEAWLIPSLLISMALWWVGMRYAADIASISAEEMRAVVQRDWIILFGSILLAAFIGGSSGSDAIGAARFAVPLQLIASFALIAAAETESTRRIAIRRGGTAPGWGRWFRLAGGFSLGIVVFSVAILALLSPDVLNAMLDGLATVARFAGWVASWILFAIVWVLYQIGIGIAWVVEALFGDMFGPAEPPEMPGAFGGEMPPVEDRGEPTGAWEYAALLRWGGLGLLVLGLALVLFRLVRRPSADDDDGDVEEHRDSVFSSDLAKQQLRDLFRRRRRDRQPLVLDLDTPPRDFRETMRYLEVLANRQGESRRPDETATDFAARLRAHWPGVASPLVQLPKAYDRARYGEQSEPADADVAASLWRSIWGARKDQGKDDEPPKPSRWE